MQQPNQTCIICRGTKFRRIANRLRDSEDYKVVKCEQCGHVQISPLPSPEDDKAFYDADKLSKNVWGARGIDEIRKTLYYDTKRRARFIASYLQPSSRICDIGSGYGFFLEEMSNAGYSMVGVEVSEERRALAKKVTSAPVLDIDLNLHELPADIGKFDVVTMFHVLEHLSNPIGFLQKLHRILVKGGYLFVEVPNLNDLMLEACEPYRSFYWQRAHISYFSADIIKRVLLDAGFDQIEIKGVQRYGIENMMNWLITGNPQLQEPSFQTSGPHAWLEKYYKDYLEDKKLCDTLMAIAREPSSPPTKSQNENRRKLGRVKRT